MRITYSIESYRNIGGVWEVDGLFLLSIYVLYLFRSSYYQYIKLYFRASGLIFLLCMYLASYGVLIERILKVQLLLCFTPFSLSRLEC